MSVFGILKKSVRAIAKPVAKLSGNKLVQAAVPMLAINSSIVASTAKGGPKAGMKAAEVALKNPVIRKAAAATALVFPAAVPVVAAQEAAIRTLDAIKSKNPQVAAGAVLQVAATFQGASINPDMARAAAALKTVAKARTLVTAASKAVGAQKAQLEAEIAKTPAAVLYAARQVALNPTPAGTAARKELAKTAEGRKTIQALQHVAKTLPKTVQVRQFTVDRSGRIRHANTGRLVR